MSSDRKSSEQETEIETLRRKVVDLESRLAVSTGSSSNQSIVGVRNLALRYDAGSGEILQVNSPFASYVKIGKADLVGQPVQVLASTLGMEAFREISRTADADCEPVRIADETGTVFEILRNLHDGVVDVVMRDITETQQFKSYVHRYFGLDLDALSDEDKRTLSFPERRFISISFTDLRGFTRFTDTNSPEDVRNAINAYFDEVIEAAEENGVFPNQIVGDEVMVLYGAPRHYRDHALRAIKTACEHIERVTRLRMKYSREEKEIPHCGIGINSGDVIVGDMGSSVRDRKTYTALGTAVNLASRLCSCAGEGQVFLSEMTLKAVLETMPDSWQSEESMPVIPEGQPDSVLEKPEGKIDDVSPLPRSLAGKEIRIGPDLATGSTPEYLFRYLFQIKAKGIATALPVLTVERGKDVALDRDVLSEVIETPEDGGMILGRFRLMRHIGSGAMGTVWKARDEFANVVAIKMLKAGNDASEAQIERFKREAKVMGRLAHRNICRIHEVGKADGRIFLAMQFIDGISLEQLIHHQARATGVFGSAAARSSRIRTSASIEGDDFSDIVDSVQSTESLVEGPKDGTGSEASGVNESAFLSQVTMTHQQVLAIVSRICDAVQFAHERGVLHRDLKPANIMIGRDGEPVVMDFGLAKLNQRGDDDRESMSLSIEGQVVGTIEYMAPEQALSSKEVSEQADVYSIGAILYHLITGQKPFHSSGNLLTDAEALQDHEPVSPRRLDKYIDSDLDTIILKALQPDRNQRYRSAAQIRQDIERYQSGDPISARKPTIGYRLRKKVRKNKLPFTLAAVVLILLATVAAVVIYDHQKNYGSWNQVEHLDFTGEPVDENLFYCFDQNGEESTQALEIVAGKQGVRLMQDRWLWLARQSIRGDAKVEVLMRYEGEPEGFQICINGNRNSARSFCADTGADSWDLNPIGYACRYGIWGGELAVITANRQPEKGSLNRHIPVSAPWNQTFLLTFQREKGVIKLLVNNQEKHRETVLVPLRGVDYSDIGFRTWGGNVYLKSIKVYRFTLPREASPTVAGDSLVQIGETEKAIERYLSIAEDYPKSDPGALALAKAFQLWNQVYLGTSEGGAQKEVLRQQIRAALENHPRGRAHADEIRRIQAPLEALNDFSKGRHRKALQLFPEILRLDPDSRIALECLQIDHRSISAQAARDLLPWVAKTRNVAAVELQALQLADISALGRIEKLTALDVRENQLQSLEALRGKPLKALYCMGNQIATLEPVRQANLEVLYCGDNRISDIAPLENMPALYEFSCSNNQVSDLSPLRGKNLSGYFDCSGNDISDLGPLAEVRFQVLYCANNRISDLSPLQGNRELHTLDCAGNPVSDLMPLQDVPLRVLDISHTDVRSVAALINHPHLQHLTCIGTEIEDLETLRAAGVTIKTGN